MNEKVKDFIIQLIGAGFEVWTNDSRDKTRWYYIVKDNKIGYFDFHEWRGFGFTSVHKPCKECGTGFSIRRDVDTPSVNLAEEACNLVAWPQYEKYVRKYSGWEDFTQKTYGSKTFVKIEINEPV